VEGAPADNKQARAEENKAPGRPLGGKDRCGQPARQVADDHYVAHRLSAR
jgi:hypothetical protein